MSYAADHAGALASVREAGAAVTFTRTVQTHTESTDDVSPTTSTVSGYAVRKRGVPKAYAPDTLTTTELVTLFFVPTTFGEKPVLGSVVVWASVKYRVKYLESLEPDGTSIASTVVVAK